LSIRWDDGNIPSDPGGGGGQPSAGQAVINVVGENGNLVQIPAGNAFAIGTDIWPVNTEQKMVTVITEDGMKIIDLTKNIASTPENTQVNNQGTQSTYPLNSAANFPSSAVNSKPVAKYIFEGLGWGHCVGMSQHGALGMAKAGFNYRDIIKYYYTGTEIIKLG